MKQARFAPSDVFYEVNGAGEEWAAVLNGDAQLGPHRAELSLPLFG